MSDVLSQLPQHYRPFTPESGIVECPVSARPGDELIAQLGIEDLELAPDATVLDVASGASTLTDELRFQGMQAFAVDPAYADLEAMEGRVRANISDMTSFGRHEQAASQSQTLEDFLGIKDKEPGKYIAASGNKLPVADSSVDALFSVAGVLGHIDTDPALLRDVLLEMHRAAKPGADILLMAEVIASPTPLLRQIPELMQEFNSPQEAIRQLHAAEMSELHIHEQIRHKNHRPVLEAMYSAGLLQPIALDIQPNHRVLKLKVRK